MYPDPVYRQTKSETPWGKIILFGCGGLLVLAVLAGVAIFLGIRHALKSSDAYTAAVAALRQSAAATKVLGEITDTGIPSGSVSVEGGGSGKATFRMSVTGTLASGEFYVTMTRVNAEWIVDSGRLVLEDGRGIDLEGKTALGTGGSNRGRIHPPVAGGSTSGGKQLGSGPIDTSSWQEVEWTQQRIKFRLPPGWIAKEMSQRQLDYRSGETYSPVYFAGNAWIWDRELPAEDLLAADLKSAAESFRNGVTLGYAVREVGGTSGILTISNVGDRLSATWRAIVANSGEQRSIDFLLGAPAHEFDRLSPTFNAILESLSFE
jgi:hypothetical protein